MELFAAAMLHFDDDVWDDVERAHREATGATPPARVDGDADRAQPPPSTSP